MNKDMEKSNKQDEEKITVIKVSGNVSTLNPSQAQHEIDEKKNDMRAKQEKEKLENQERELDVQKAKDILIDPASATAAAR